MRSMARILRRQDLPLTAGSKICASGWTRRRDESVPNLSHRLEILRCVWHLPPPTTTTAAAGHRGGVFAGDHQSVAQVIPTPIWKAQNDQGMKMKPEEGNLPSIIPQSHPPATGHGIAVEHKCQRAIIRPMVQLQAQSCMPQGPHALATLPTPHLRARQWWIGLFLPAADTSCFSSLCLCLPMQLGAGFVCFSPMVDGRVADSALYSLETKTRAQSYCSSSTGSRDIGGNAAEVAHRCGRGQGETETCLTKGPRVRVYMRGRDPRRLVCNSRGSRGEQPNLPARRRCPTNTEAAVARLRIGLTGKPHQSVRWATHECAAVPLGPLAREGRSPAPSAQELGEGADFRAPRCQWAKMWSWAMRGGGEVGPLM